MAKGRKHGSTDRYDRLLGTYGYGNGHVPSTDQPDLGEDDVWLTSSPGQSSTGSWTGSESDGVNPAQSSRARHWVRGPKNGNGPAAVNRSNRHTAAAAAASAPVNVPGWSKMGRVDSTDSMNGSIEWERDESEWIPPHEYIAREHGRTATTSVFEGVGRTLKGRDMSRVRDAVWSQTGFFG